MDPNERMPGPPTIYEDLKNLPASVKLPPGATKSSKDWYVQKYTTLNGRTFYEFYKRGNQGEGATDPVVETVEGAVNTEQAEKFKKDQEAAAKPPSTVSAPPTQATIVTQGPGGTLNTLPNPNYVPPAAATGAPPAGTAARVETEGTPDPSKPNGYDNSRPRKASYWPNGTVTYEPLTPAEMTNWRREQGIAEPKAPETGKPYKNAQGQWVYPVTDATGTVSTRPVPADAIPSEGETKYGPAHKNAAGQWVQPIMSPSGQVTGEVPVPAGAVPAEKPEKPQIIKGAAGKPDMQAVDDPDHPGQVKYIPIPGQGGGIKGVPPFTPDFTKSGAGIIDRAKQLDEMMAAGDLTWEQRQEVLAQDQVLAATVAAEFNAGAATLRDDYQNQVSQRGQDITNTQHRASLANQHMTNAMGLMEKFSPYLGGTPGAARNMFLSTMASQLLTAKAYGGMQDYPREQLHPALKGWAERAVGGAAGPAPAGVGGPPTADRQAAPAGGPNALGVGSVGPVPAPGAPLNIQQFDQTPAGPVPRVRTPAAASSVAPAMPPPPPGYEPALSWRQDAMQAEDDFLGGAAQSGIGLGEGLMGSALPPIANTDPMSGSDFMGGPMGAPPLAMSSGVAGLTPEQDEQARRELDQELFGRGRAA